MRHVGVLQIVGDAINARFRDDCPGLNSWSLKPLRVRTSSWELPCLQSETPTPQPRAGSQEPETRRGLHPLPHGRAGLLAEEGVQVGGGEGGVDIVEGALFP